MCRRGCSFAYDRNGRIASVVIDDARDRTVTFVIDEHGQGLTRVELDLIPSRRTTNDRYWYFNGRRIGQVSNDGDYSARQRRRRPFTAPT